MPAESPADAATTIFEENAPSGAAAPGQRTQRCARPASRPRYRDGRQSYRAAPYAPAPAGPAASGTNAGCINCDRTQSRADESWSDEPAPERLAVEPGGSRASDGGGLGP
eukprot:8077151-Pyramimonas_sp.AAC.1